MKTQKTSNQTPPEPFDLFTGGKPASLTIAMNTAYDNIEKLLAQLNEKKISELVKQTSKTIMEPLAESSYTHLRNFLWKGYLENKNQSGYIPDDSDKTLIHSLIIKLNDLRNFHSHAWHDNQPLDFDQLLYKFVTLRYERAKAAICEQYPTEMGRFEKQEGDFPLFKNVAGKKFITQEGRRFFLGFFLTTGEMSRLLQGSRGSKNTSAPDFKVKHLIYKYYCHRDGSSYTGHHQEESVFNGMPHEEKANILAARSAYKIISYLNDLPEYYAKPELFPLLVKNNDSNSHDEMQIAGDVHSLIRFCNHYHYFSFLTFKPVINKDGHQHPGMIDIEYPNTDFRLGQTLLHQLIIRRILNGEKTEEFVRTKLELYAAERRKVHEFIRSNLENPAAVDWDAQHELLSGLRGNAKMRDWISEWRDQNSGRPDKTGRTVWNLFNATRSKDEPGRVKPISSNKHFSKKSFGAKKATTIPSPEPIFLIPFDFISNEKEKLRDENKFMTWAVRFLIDEKITPDWHWQQRTLLTDEHGKQRWRSEFVKGNNYDFEPPFINEQVLVGIPRKSGNGFNRFLLGPQAMRLLLAIHLLGAENKKSPQRSINTFLSESIAGDFEKILLASQEQKEIDFKQTEWLEPKHIPDLYKRLASKKTTSGATQEVLSKYAEITSKRIDKLILKLNQQAESAGRMRRQEKNRIILQSYTLFDWHIKFLRKNEYEQMSICHYVIHEQSKFNHLFEKEFQLSKRVPEEVKKLLKKSLSLDDLLKNTVVAVSKKLENWKVQLSSGHIPKQEIAAIMRRIGIAVPEQLLQLKEKAVTTREQLKTTSILPFDIDPSLVLKWWDKPGYEQKKYTASNDKHPFALIRKQELVSGLRTEHYNREALKACGGETPTKKEKTIVNNIIGRMELVKTEDIILWWMARQYLQKNSLTNKFGAVLQNTLQQNGNLQVGSLHTSEVILPVEHRKSGHKTHVRLRMHQLDDTMFRLDEERLCDAAKHFVHRMTEPNVTVDKACSQTADGSAEHPLDYDCLRREIQRVFREAEKTADKLLAWELAAIQRYCVQEKQGSPGDMHRYLLAKYSPKTGYPRLAFRDVLTMAASELSAAGVTENQMRKLRNDAFHSHIPTDGSFAEKLQPGTALGILLNVTERLDKPRDNSAYIP